MSNIFGSDSGSAVPGGNLTKPLVIALLALLASRYMGGGQKQSIRRRTHPRLLKLPRRLRRRMRLPAACSMVLAA